MALTPKDPRNTVPTRTLPPGAAQQLGSVPTNALPGAKPQLPPLDLTRKPAGQPAPPRPPAPRPPPPPGSMVVAGPRTVNPDPLGRAPALPGGQPMTTPERFTTAQIQNARAQTNARMAPLPGAAASALGAAPQVAPSPLGAAPPGAPAAAAPTPAAAALGTPPPGGPTSRILQAAKGTGRSLGRAAPAVGALLEGADVARVAQDPNASKIDVATQAFEGTGRLATGYLGAKGGAAAGALGGPFAPITVPAGAVIGGIAGYVGGDKLIDAGRAMGDTPNSIIGEQAGRAAAPGLGPAGPLAGPIGSFLGALTDAPDSSPAASAPDITSVAPASAPAPASTALAAPAATGADEVIGTFNGKDITRGQADALAGQLPTVAAQPAAAAPAPAAVQLGAQVGSPGIGTSMERRKLGEQIDKTIADLGDLNMRGKRDLAGQLLGLKTNLATGGAGNENQRLIEQARITAGSAAEQLGSNTQKEVAQIGASSRSGGAPIVGEDGNLYTLQGNTLAPVTGADGKPAKAPTSNKEAQALYGDLVKQLTIGGETPEQLAAIKQQAAELSGIGAEKPGATAAPEGYTQVGTSPDGKPVFKDAKGNTFTQ